MQPTFCGDDEGTTVHHRCLYTSWDAALMHYNYSVPEQTPVMESAGIW